MADCAGQMRLLLLGGLAIEVLVLVTALSWLIAEAWSAWQDRRWRRRWRRWGRC